MISQSFIYSRSGESPRSLSVHIEDPSLRRNEGEKVWECRVEIPGQWEAVMVSGGSPIQATSLALRFVRECFERLNLDGEVSHATGTAVNMDELFGLSSPSTEASRL